VNGKPGTKAEVAALARAAAKAEWDADPDAEHLKTLHAKLTAPFKPRDDGPDMVKIQDILVGSGGGRIIPIVGANDAWWGTLSRRCKGRDITPETAVVVGKWLAEQPWADGMTVDRAAAGWPSYLARARNQRKTDAGTGRRDYDPGDAGGLA